MNYFANLNIIYQTLIATIFTFTLTSIGSSLVFAFKKINKTVLDIMLSLSAGIMIAASFFSLLNPAINLANNLNMKAWFVLTLGFIVGGLLLFASGIYFDKILSKKEKKLSLKRCIMLFLSITIHNIPEGMAVGVAFASSSLNIEGATLGSAITLALGIGIQNLPEGSAVSLPLRREGLSRFKAFLFGSISGIVEVFAGLIGAILVLKIRVLLPFLLSFAAGAMIYVVILELVPESQTNKNKDLRAFFSLVGFAIMMILDIRLG